MRDCPTCGAPVGPTDRRCFVCETPLAPGAVEAPLSGRDVVLAHGRELYGPEERVHTEGLGSLDAVALWRVERPRPHRLLIGLGLTFQGVASERSELSGRGFELTCRTSGDDVQRLIQLMDRRAAEVAPELPPRAPVLWRLGLRQDPELDTLETPNGRVYFLELMPPDGDFFP